MNALSQITKSLGLVGLLALVAGPSQAQKSIGKVLTPPKPTPTAPQPQPQPTPTEQSQTTTTPTSAPTRAGGIMGAPKPQPVPERQQPTATPAPAPAGPATTAGMPAWGPAAPSGTQYYRLSAFNGYYDIKRKKYFYYSPNMKKWVGSDQPPVAWRDKDPRTFGATPISYVGDSPWREKEAGAGTTATVPTTRMAPTPTWGPKAAYGTQYYRLSAFNGYYDINSKKYFYYSPESKNWVGGTQPPPAWRDKDPRTFGATPISYVGDSPWRESEGVKVRKVPPGLAKKGVLTHPGNK